MCCRPGTWRGEGEGEEGGKWEERSGRREGEGEGERREEEWGVGRGEGEGGGRKGILVNASVTLLFFLSDVNGRNTGYPEPLQWSQ